MTPDDFRAVISRLDQYLSEGRERTAKAGEGLAELSRLNAAVSDLKLAFGKIEDRLKLLEEWRAEERGARGARAPWVSSLISIAISVISATLVILFGLKK